MTGTEDTATCRDDLPRFAAAKVLVYSYGDDWATWAFLGSGFALLLVMFFALTDASTAPFTEVYPAVLAFGFVAFWAGMFVGVMWVALREDAQERQSLKNDK